MSTQLTKHFTLYEMYRSTTAEARGIDNTPPIYILDNLLTVAVNLEKLRTLLNTLKTTDKDVYIKINSGYRSSEVNKLVGGSTTSDHMQGLAVDIIAPVFGTPKTICEIIAQHKPFKWDQLIFEQSWCHIGFGSKMRGQVFSILSGKQSNGIVSL